MTGLILDTLDATQYERLMARARVLDRQGNTKDYLSILQDVARRDGVPEIMRKKIVLRLKSAGIPDPLATFREIHRDREEQERRLALAESQEAQRIQRAEEKRQAAAAKRTEKQRQRAAQDEAREKLYDEIVRRVGARQSNEQIAEELNTTVHYVKRARLITGAKGRTRTVRK